MIAHIVGRHFVEQLGATVNLCIFDSIELHGLERTFGFCYEENVFDAALLHGYRPVGSITADGSRNLERTREF